MSTETLNENQLVRRVKELDPTIISLAFCHTRTSILNDILRSVGVYSKIILSQDRYNITNGNVFTLDEEQKQIIEKISKTKGQNVILWGSHGTGKTLLLAEVLSIKISQYKKMGKLMKVIISSYSNNSNDAPLMEDLRNNYLSHLVCETFAEFIDFKHLCKGISNTESAIKIQLQLFSYDIIVLGVTTANRNIKR